MVENTDASKQSDSDKDGDQRIARQLDLALALKDYAINANLHVSEDTIKRLNHARRVRAEGEDLSELVNEIDIAVKELTAETYPTTIATIAATKEAKPTGYLYRLLIFAGLVLILAVVSYHDDDQVLSVFPSLLAVSLGALGALVYVFFNVIGVMRESAFDPSDYLEHTVRVILGAILGWLFFIVFLRQFSVNGESMSDRLMLLLPFLAGFSTKLVFGVLTQGIRAVELTLGIEDASSQLLRRGSKRGRTQLPT